MEYIQNIYNVVNDYWLLSIVVGMTSVFVESFLPILPLVAIVTANAVLFGMIPGLVISWIGSSAGTICLFFIVRKISNRKFIKLLTNEKVGIAKRDFADFIPAVVAGKLVMFFIVSYIGKDIFGFITNPFKVCALLIITFIAWKMGNKLNKDLDEYEKKRINEE